MISYKNKWRVRNQDKGKRKKIVKKNNYLKSLVEVLIKCLVIQVGR